MPKVVPMVAAADPTDKRFLFFCPGCLKRHQFRVAGPEPRWIFNGDVERPTVSPSIFTDAGWLDRRCHCFIADGRIQFLDDCFHHLRGTTIDLPDFPDPRSERGFGLTSRFVKVITPPAD